MEEKNYILYDLPENYRLFEHVKSKALDPDGKPQKSVKAHAGGGHDRQDAYLYGHPSGRKKRYRSPADFFPHLLWLVTDESSDRNNCSCKLCSPEELQNDEKPTTSRNARPEVSVKREEKLPVHVKRENPAAVSKSSRIQSNPSSMKASDIAKRSITPTNTPRNLNPSPLPQPRCRDQQIDAQYNKFIFRPGEILWFSRGEAWGLSLVTRRYFLSNSSSKIEKAYIVQPLSHPYAHPSAVTITREDLLRPWLAWSAPPYTCELLNSMSVTYDTADWQGIISKKYGFGDAEVDGSILAAKAVDASYTLFDFMKRISQGNGVEELYWNGIYLGGEKIWVGDPTRLRGENSSDILVVTFIVEKKINNSENKVSETNLIFIGDVYTFSAMHFVGGNMPNSSNIPERMREDLIFRNTVTANASRPAGYWKLVQANARVDVNSVKGRWYESSILFPILRGAAFADDIRRGDIYDTGLWMNARGESVTGFRGIGVNKADRLNALGAAIPNGTAIISGIDPPAGANRMEATLANDFSHQPIQQQAQQQQVRYPQLPSEQHEHVDQLQAPIQDSGHGALEEFMNLEGIPGFGQEYGSQSQNYM